MERNRPFVQDWQEIIRTFECDRLAGLIGTMAFRKAMMAGSLLVDELTYCRLSEYDHGNDALSATDLVLEVAIKDRLGETPPTLNQGLVDYYTTMIAALLESLRTPLRWCDLEPGERGALTALHCLLPSGGSETVGCFDETRLTGTDVLSAPLRTLVWLKRNGCRKPEWLEPSDAVG